MISASPLAPVRRPSADVAAMSDDWSLVHDLLGGTSAMRTAAKKHLPQWPNEGDNSYKTRKDTAVLFPAFSRTVEVLGGKPFSKPVQIDDDVPERIREWCQDIDLQGRDLHAFAQSLCLCALSYGLAGILVDYPQVNGLVTVADERAADVRPYFVEVPAANILGWRVERRNGAAILAQLRLLEIAVEPDGDFGETSIEQVRVLTPGTWQIWREDPNSQNEDKWILHAEGTTTLDVIPFVPVYGIRTGYLTARPPLLDLAHLNVEHWQSKSDQQTILHVARVPILFMKGIDTTNVTIGASSAVTSQEPTADMKFVEHSGAAIAAGRQSLLDLEDRMRQIGAELLVIKPANQTVAATQADNEPGKCTLQSIIQGLEHAIDDALALMAEWVDEDDGGHVQIFQDFGVSSLSDGSMAEVRGMASDGALSNESVFHEAKRRGLVRPEATWDDEQQKISAQPKVGQVPAPSNPQY